MVLLLILRIFVTLMALADGGPPGAGAPRPSARPPSAPPSTAPEPAPSESVRPRPSRRSWWARLLARAFPAFAVAFVAAAVALWLARAQQPEILPEGVREETQLPLGLLLLGLSLSAVWVLWRVPQWQAAAWAEQAGANPRERFEIENASRGTLGQILSGVAVLAGLIFAWQQLGSTTRSVQLNEQGQITDRFTRAVDQLGSDNASARLGGIYALEQIARDSERDYLPAMEVLAEFIRESGAAPAEGGTPVAAAGPRRETVAAIRVIARRNPEQMELQAEQGIGCIDLSGVNLTQLSLAEGANFDALCFDDADLSGAVLPGATFAGSSLTNTRLVDARLEGAVFLGTDMTRVDLEESDLTDARLDGAALGDANLSGADLFATNLRDSQLLGASLAGASLVGTVFANADLTAVDLTSAFFAGADLSSALGVTAEQLAAADLDSATVLPAGVAATPDF